MASILRLLTDLKKRHHEEQQRQADREANDERARRNHRLNLLEAGLKQKSVESFWRQHPEHAPKDWVPTPPLSDDPRLKLQAAANAAVQNKLPPTPMTNDQFPITPSQLTPARNPATLQERLPTPEQT
jgi:hypothetical protein